ncbi:MAG: hypothetical protein LBV43_11950 [Prevotella sp.]|jgi:hypothetical protein|nr:hypothetical protein [Prevotella sp.]
MGIKTKVQRKIDPKTGKVIDTKWGNEQWESEQGIIDWGLVKVIIIALIVVGIISGIASLF